MINGIEAKYLRIPNTHGHGRQVAEILAPLVNPHGDFDVLEIRNKQNRTHPYRYLGYDNSIQTARILGYNNPAFEVTRLVAPISNRPISYYLETDLYGIVFDPRIKGKELILDRLVAIIQMQKRPSLREQLTDRVRDWHSSFFAPNRVEL